ncbi:MAG: hypothetical protein O9264_07985 [Leptospira sp.]|nr:hypothetical protein [Leptospira sp.]
MFLNKITLFLILLLFLTGSVQSDSTKVEQILPTSPDKNSPWGADPERFKEIQILDLIDESTSQKRWKEANREYSIAIESFENAIKVVDKKREDAAKVVYYEDRYEWQKKSRNDAREKEFQRQIYEARNQANSKLIRAMALLDKIENPKVKSSDPYLDLKAGLFREYIKHQDAFKNYFQTADFLERYIALSEKHEKEAEPHRLLALSYEKLEATATKAKNPLMAEEWKENKKKHLLRFAELHYGKESKEYLAIEEKVAKDI